KLFTRTNRHTIEFDNNVALFDTRHISRSTAQNGSEFHAMNIHSRNGNSLSIAIFITELSTSFGASLKLARQLPLVVLRDGCKFGDLLLAVTRILNVDSLSNRRFCQQVV